MSDIDKKQYDRVAASGTVDVANLELKGKTLPLPLVIQQASLRLRPERAELTSFTGSVGSSDLQASGSIDNLISYLFRDDTLTRLGDGEEQPVRSGRVALGRGRPRDHPGAGQAGLHA